MSKQETSEDIIAEMLGGPIPRHLNDRELLRNYADRFKAALKREKAEIEAKALEVGAILSKQAENDNSVDAVITDENNVNSAAIREALANLVEVIDRYDSGSPLWWHDGAKGVMPLKNAKAALAEPMRNCDVGTTEEQAHRFHEFCMAHQSPIKGMCDPTCPCHEQPDKCHCMTAWAQMPYKEGGER